MARDCIALCTAQIPSQVEGTKFKPPPHLCPTIKDTLPFDTWCTNSIGPFMPPGTGGVKYLVVCICATSKWVEAWPVVALTSRAVASAFHLNVTCRFGVPRVVRTDRGREYMGEFKKYLVGIGVDHRVTSTAHPRANGLVERHNKVIK